MADHQRSCEQQEADATASKGCGMFEFLKKKSEDVPSSEKADVTKDNKEEEKHSLAERLHPSDSSSSSDDEEACENGEKKKKKDAGDEGEIEEKKSIVEKIKEKLPSAKGHNQANKPEHEDGKEKGFMEKMKEKLPESQHGKPEPEPNHENSKEKGFIEKIKEKLPGHTKHDDEDEKKKET